MFTVTIDNSYPLPYQVRNPDGFIIAAFFEPTHADTYVNACNAGYLP